MENKTIHKFTDSNGTEYEFNTYRKSILNENLELVDSIYVIVRAFHKYRAFSTAWIPEYFINNKKVWKKRCKFSEEFRLYLEKFIKFPAFF